MSLPRGADRLVIVDHDAEVVRLLKLVTTLLKQIEANTARRKPGRPKKETTRV